MFDEEKVQCGIIVLVKVKGAGNKVDEGDHTNDDDDDGYHCKSEGVSS